MSEWEKDYKQLQQSFIYEKSKPFDELIEQMQVLTNRIRTMSKSQIN